MPKSLRQLSAIAFLVVVGCENLVNPPESSDNSGLILWNKLEDMVNLSSSNFSPSLEVPSGTIEFATGKFGKGFVAPKPNGQRSEVPSIPDGTFDLSDFTIEFWYKRTEPISGVMLLLTRKIQGGVTDANYNAVCVGIDESGAATLVARSMWVQVVFNHSLDQDTFKVFRFNSMAEIESLLPLNTLVHIAVARKNNGTIDLFVDGVEQDLLRTFSYKAGDHEFKTS